MNYFSRNGEILPLEKATVSLKNIEYSYGFGVYETLKIRGGEIYHLEKHCSRLLRSAKVLGLEHTFDYDNIKNKIEALKEKLNEQSYNLKMLLIGGKTPEEAQLNIIPLAPLFPPRKLYKEGVRVTPFNYERAFPKAKTLNMLMSYIAFREAKKDSSYDALLIDSEGMVLEGSRCNFFAMKGRELISPPEEKILDGITRENVLKVALENGYTLTYDDIPLEKIGDYDGLFLTSTSAKLLPISKVGNLETPISSELFELIKLVKKSGKV